MPLFKCSACGCVENTALSHYWVRGESAPLCSACDPKIGSWHGLFPRRQADGYVEGPDGFLTPSGDRGATLMKNDPISRLDSVANDGETAMLDDLQERAGLTWECRDKHGGYDSHWTNPEDANKCEGCGKPRRRSRQT